MAQGRPTVDELIALGLYDPDEKLASERLALIEYLLDLGATVDELVAAYPDLAVVASTRALRGSGALLTEPELAARAGVPIETSARVWRAAGFSDPGPGARIFTEEEAEALRIYQAAAEWLGEETVLQVVRVIGSSMARIADAAIAAFLVNVGGPALADDPGGLALARANTEAVALLRGASEVLDVIFLRHVEALQRPVNPGDQTTQELTVGFADLVGSTALAQRLSIRELGTALAEFDELTADVVVDAGGRAVKLIGDEVMYVAPAPSTGCEIALRLSERFSDHPRLPPVRGGLAHGSVLTRDGDYFGPVVNLASRTIKLAGPSAVLAEATVRAAADGYEFTSIGSPELKGFEVPIELFEVRRR